MSFAIEIWECATTYTHFSHTTVIADAPSLDFHNKNISHERDKTDTTNNAVPQGNPIVVIQIKQD